MAPKISFDELCHHVDWTYDPSAPYCKGLPTAATPRKTYKIPLGELCHHIGWTYDPWAPYGMGPPKQEESLKEAHDQQINMAFELTQNLRQHPDNIDQKPTGDRIDTVKQCTISTSSSSRGPPSSIPTTISWERAKRVNILNLPTRLPCDLQQRCNKRGQNRYWSDNVDVLNEDGFRTFQSYKPAYQLDSEKAEGRIKNMEPPSKMARGSKADRKLRL